MQELAKLLEGFTPGAYGIWTGVLMFAGWWLKEWRETRKLSLDDRNAKREGYAKQVAELMRENRELRSDLTDAEDKHDRYRKACQEETDQLRSDIRSLEDMVTGFKRRLDQQASTLGRAILGADAPVAAVKFGYDTKGTIHD